jgi:hypothetical protein
VSIYVSVANGPNGPNGPRVCSFLFFSVAAEKNHGHDFFLLLKAKEEMPLVGADRALAHYKSAMRYADKGNKMKGLSHMDRAIDYMRRTHFGAIYTGELGTMVSDAMTKHDLTDFRSQEQNHLPTVEISEGYVAISHNSDQRSAGWTWYGDAIEQTLDELVDTLDRLAADLSVPWEYRAMLHRGMLEVYSKIIIQLRTEPQAKRPRH